MHVVAAVIFRNGVQPEWLIGPQVIDLQRAAGLPAESGDALCNLPLVQGSSARLPDCPERPRRIFENKLLSGSGGGHPA